MQSVKAEPSDEDEETEYFDAMEDTQNFIAVAADLTKHHRWVVSPHFGKHLAIHRVPFSMPAILRGIGLASV